MERTEAEERIDAYCLCWSAVDEPDRLNQLRAAVTEDVRYTDPRADVAGVAALADYIGKVLQAAPAARVERTTPADFHHGFARFGWQFVQDGEARLVGSIDVVEFADDGRLRRINGFFGRLSTD